VRAELPPGATAVTVQHGFAFAPWQRRVEPAPAARRRCARS
jgi:hypothetical protein